MEKRGHEKTSDRLNRKKARLENKVKKARDKASTAGASLATAMGAGDILARVQKCIECVELDPKVLRAQIKLKKFCEKNQAKLAAQRYTTSTAPGQRFSVTDQSGLDANTQSMTDNSIHVAVQKNKDEVKKAVITTFENFKDLINELLTTARQVGFMYISDGGKGHQNNTERKVAIANLQLEDLVFAKNRELLVITAK
jgi:hypothetical protein